MEKKFVALWDKNKSKLESALREGLKEEYWYFDYSQLMELVITNILNEGDYKFKIHTTLDTNDYQGEMAFIFGTEEISYIEDLFITTVSYGSCSGCDTLQAALHCDEFDDVIKNIMLLALHLIQDARPLINKN